MARQTGLGRGFGTLIPQTVSPELLVDGNERIHKLSVTLLSPNPDQPRTIFDETSLGELAASIKQYGVIQPLVVTPNDKGYYIVAGERRWRAAQIAGLQVIPAIVRTAQQQDRLELAILENVQRVDLSPLETAVSVEKLHQQFNMAYSDIAKRLGKAETTVHNIVRLLQLPVESRDALTAGTITEGHARQILALKESADLQADLLKLIIKNEWSVRQTERYVSSLKAGIRESKQTLARVSGITPETERLAQRFGTKVRIHRMAKGGRVEIAFTDEEQLAKLLAELEN